MIRFGRTYKTKLDDKELWTSESFFARKGKFVIRLVISEKELAPQSGDGIEIENWGTPDELVVNDVNYVQPHTYLVEVWDYDTWIKDQGDELEEDIRARST
jgi:hypothetical protein